MVGMMFSDLGHGALVFSAGAALCLGADKLKETPAGELLAGFRYFILLVGFFSMYVGFIFNEFFAIPMNAFPSCFYLDKKTQFDALLIDDGYGLPNSTQPDNSTNSWVYERISHDCVYPMG